MDKMHGFYGLGLSWILCACFIYIYNKYHVPKCDYFFIDNFVINVFNANNFKNNPQCYLTYLVETSKFKTSKLYVQQYRENIDDEHIHIHFLKFTRLRDSSELLLSIIIKINEFIYFSFNCTKRWLIDTRMIIN